MNPGPLTLSLLSGVATDAHAVHTVGALDLGGSSLEVTFVPKPGAPIVDIRDSRAHEVLQSFVLHGTPVVSLRTSSHTQLSHLVCGVTASLASLSSAWSA